MPLEETGIKSVESIRNGKHSHSIESVKMLVQRVVGLTLEGTMGAGGLKGCQKGRDGGQMWNSRDGCGAVDSYLKGETLPMGEDALCRCGPRCLMWFLSHTA
jgi:hypothetical protein